MNTQSTAEWRDIPGYEGLYLASADGEIYSIRRRKKLELVPETRKGRFTVTLGKGGHQQKFNVAWLIASAFYGPRPKGYEVHHKNENITDDSVDNLEYKSRDEHQEEHQKRRTSRRVQARVTLRVESEEDSLVRGDSEMIEREFVQFLNEEVIRFGTQHAMADHYGFSDALISQVINKHVPPGKRLLKALGFKKMTIYVREENNG